MKVLGGGSSSNPDFLEFKQSRGAAIDQSLSFLIPSHPPATEMSVLIFDMTSQCLASEARAWQRLGHERLPFVQLFSNKGHNLTVIHHVGLCLVGPFIFGDGNGSGSSSHNDAFLHLYIPGPGKIQKQEDPRMLQEKRMHNAEALQYNR